MASEIEFEGLPPAESRPWLRLTLGTDGGLELFIPTDVDGSGYHVPFRWNPNKPEEALHTLQRMLLEQAAATREHRRKQHGTWAAPSIDQIEAWCALRPRPNDLDAPRSPKVRADAKPPPSKAEATLEKLGLL